MSDISLTIGGDLTGLITATKEAKAVVAEASEGMKGAFEKVSGAFEKVQVAMLAVTAVLAGGKAFKEAIDASVNAAKEAQNLGRQLGVTATQASVLRVAMDDNFVSTEAVQGAANKIAQTLRKNEDAYKNLGVATRDQNGHFRNSFDIMQDVNERLAEFKEGTDRNVEGQKIYGKAWAEIAPSIRITKEAMAEAKIRAEELGLTVGERGVAQATAYRKAMNDVHDVFEGVMKAVGDALLPTMTKLGQWFAEVGPVAIEYTKKAIVGLTIAFEGIVVTLQTVYEFVAGFVEQLVGLFVTLANTIERVLHFDFSGAKAAWSKGWGEMQDEANQRIDNIKKHFEDASSSVADMLDQTDNSQDKPITKTTGNDSSDNVSESRSRSSEWEAALEQKKAAWQAEQIAEGSFREFSKQQEVAYWQNILDTVKVSTAERLTIEKKIATERLAIQRSAFDAQQAALKTEEAEHKNNTAERLAVEIQYAENVRRAFGEESKEYADAQKAIVATKQQAADQMRKIDDLRATSARNVALAEVDAEASAAKMKEQGGLITFDQLLAMERDFEARRYAIKEQALVAELELAQRNPDADPTKLAEINAQIEALTLQHNNAMLKINEQGQTQTDQTRKKFTDAMGNGFANAFKGILTGTMTVGKALKTMFSSLLDTIISTFAQWGAKLLMQHLLSMSLNKQEAASNAAVAATGGAASAAKIPYVGWMLAIGAAAAIFAAASSYSAEGGFDVPAGINPMTQLHEKEMVLPKNIAETVRGMADGSAPGTAAGGGGDLNVTLSGSRMGNFFMMHKDELHAALKQIHRSGARL